MGINKTIEELQNKIIESINEAALPPGVVRLIFCNLMNEIDKAYAAAVEKEAMEKENEDELHTD